MAFFALPAPVIHRHPSPAPDHPCTRAARGLANTAWAFGKLRYVPDAALPALLSTHAVARIHEFAAQNLSNLAWAMVYMHHKDEQLLGLMSQKVRCTRAQAVAPLSSPLLSPTCILWPMVLPKASRCRRLRSSACLL